MPEQEKSEAEKAADALLNESSRPTIPPVIPTPKAQPKPTIQEVADAAARMSNDDLAKLTEMVASQLAAKASQPDKKSAVPRYITDFSNLSEASIYDMSIPIQAISHEIPDFLNVKLRDKNFEARWIQTNSRRLGQAIAEGFTYITKEELAENLQVHVTPDASGHFVYADVVLMKLPKEKLYARIRSNFIKSLNTTKNVGAMHEKMREAIEQDIENSADAEDYKKYKNKKQFEVYSPLVGV